MSADAGLWTPAALAKNRVYSESLSKNAWPPAGTVASGDRGVEVVMGRE